MTVDLPCKVGDVAWGINRKFDRRYVQSGRVDEIYFSDEAMTPAIRVRHVCTGFWGVDVFPTKQDALDELKRRKTHERRYAPNERPLQKL